VIITCWRLFQLPPCKINDRPWTAVEVQIMQSITVIDPHGALGQGIIARQVHMPEVLHALYWKIPRILLCIRCIMQSRCIRAFGQRLKTVKGPLCWCQWSKYCVICCGRFKVHRTKPGDIMGIVSMATGECRERKPRGPSAPSTWGPPADAGGKRNRRPGVDKYVSVSR
jgi:hypothetical protein